MKNERATHHAQVRMVQRFGKPLSRKKISIILEAIRQQKTEYAQRLSCTRSVYGVRIDGDMVRVVYSRKCKKIITVMEDK